VTVHNTVRTPSTAHGLNTAALQSVVVSKLLSGSTARSCLVVPRQQIVSVSTHFCAVENVAASVRQIWWHSNEQLLQEADQQLFNKLCNNSDRCHSQSASAAFPINSVTTLLTAQKSTKQRRTWKNGAPHRLKFSYTPYTRGIQKVRRPTQLTTRYAHHILSLLNMGHLQLKCAWASISPKLWFRCKRIVVLGLPASHMPCR